ncbi:MAG TPA: sigma-70 family RNA polymerase sigma factor [Gemmatimonadales bacterium]|nr:sigma-70 family RNA polymerase sigma factor [Gemmatimonadales bacterium]
MEPSELERFEAIVLPHVDAAYTLARYLTGNTEDAQDIVQDAALRALKYFGGFRGTGERDGRAWLLTIVRNTVHTWRQRRHPESGGTVFDEEQHSERIAADDPALALDRKETRERLREALAQLPDEFREVIVLRDIQELSYKEISDVIGVPEGTVMSRLHRARQRLQRMLVRDGKGRERVI